jgi:hypothetical protein
MARARRRRSESGRRPRAAGREWVGGRLSSPFYVTEEESYRPELVLWLELPDDLIVGTAMAARDEPVSLAQTLLQAMHRPMVGPPRRPSRSSEPRGAAVRFLRLAATARSRRRVAARGRSAEHARVPLVVG